MKSFLGDVLEEVTEIDVEGDVIETVTVERGNDTTYHTHYDVLNDNNIKRLTVQEINDVRNDVERQLLAWSEVRLLFLFSYLCNLYGPFFSDTNQ